MNTHDAGNASAPEPLRPGSPHESTAAFGTPIDQRPTLPQPVPLPFQPPATPPGQRRAGWRRWIKPVSGVIIGIIVLGLLGGAVSLFATNSAHSTQQRDKAALDRALTVARTQYNVPPSRLQPIMDAEQRALAGMGASYSGY